MRKILSLGWLPAFRILVLCALPSVSFSQKLAPAPTSPNNQYPSLYVRAATPEEIIGVWEYLGGPGAQYQGYEVITSDGRCGSLSLKIAQNEERAKLNAQQVIEKIDSENGKEGHKDWVACALSKDVLTITHSDYTENFEVFFLTETPANAKPWVRGGVPGDIIMQPSYKPAHYLPPQTHVLTLPPSQFRRLMN